MRNLLALFAILLLLVLGLGWGRGWFLVGTLPAEPGKTSFRIDVDLAKTGSDVIVAVKSIGRLFSRQDKDKSATEALAP